VISGNALELETVKHLLEQGLIWGAKLAAETNGSYLILGECVVGGTTTALGVLMGLGIAAAGKVNSSHPRCNHAQKLAAVTAGLNNAEWEINGQNSTPLELVAAVGDPMQIAVAAMAIAASRTCGVLLAGGTQMLAVYALMQALAREYALLWRPEQVAVGTTLGGPRPYRRHCRTCVGDRRCASVGRAAKFCWISLRATASLRSRLC
jgi:NaMN:DMB phosphoribosyltransferase